jgi:4-amino-4-deoxy-L-arabinose transferase-like glycosyltransferase
MASSGTGSGSTGSAAAALPGVTPGWRLDRLPPAVLLAALAAAGLAVRLAFFDRYSLAGTDCDGAGYMEVARHIAAGLGFRTGVYKQLFLPPVSLPQPDAHWNPLYPLLTAGAFRLFGESMAAAKLVPLAFGATLPPLICLLAQALTGRRAAGWVAGLIAVVHPTLVTWSLRIETEICTMALVTAVFVLMMREGRWRGPALGVILGLACLMKYQSGMLLGVVLLHDLLARGFCRGVSGLVPVLVGFGVTVAPWLARGLLAFGHPLYNDVGYEALLTYPGFGGFSQRYWATLTPPPPFATWMLGHPAETLRHAYFGARELAFSLPSEALGSLWLVPFGLLGTARVLPAWKRWAPALLYGSLLLLAFSLTTPLARYLLSLIPFWIVLAADGAAWLAIPAGLSRPALRRTLATSVAIVMAIALVDQTRAAAARAGDRTSLWNPHSFFCPLELAAASPYIRSNTPPGEPVFSTESFHAAYLFDRPAVNIPFQAADLVKLRDRWKIRYLVIADRDIDQRLPAWRPVPPEWAQPVWRASAAEIARSLRAQDYPHLSAVTIYRIGRDRGPR